MTRNSLKNKTPTLLILLFLIQFSEIVADDFNFRPENFTHLTIEDGLPQSNVRCIEEDQYGFLWLCTGDGLVRYDGYDFELITEGADGSRISNTIVRVILADGDKLWVGTDNGINLFNLKQGTFKNILLTEDDIGANQVRSIQSTDELLFVGTGNGLYQISKQNGDFKKIELPEKFSYIRALKIVDQHLFIGGYGEGLIKYSIKDNVIEDLYSGLKNNNILTIELIDDKLWIGLFSGSYYIIDKNLSSEMYIESCFKKHRLCEGNADIFSIEQKGSVVWLGSSDGIYKIKRNQLIERITLFDYIPSPYVSNFVSDLHFLDEQNLISTLNPGGLVKIQINENAITKFEKDQETSVFNKNDIYAIEKHDNNIFVGTYNGLMILTEDQKISKVIFNQNTFTNNYKFRISSLQVYENKLFIGAFNGLFFVDINGDEYDIRKVELDIQVTSLTIDNDNNLWVGSSEGKLYRLNRYLEIHEMRDVSKLKFGSISSLKINDKYIYIGSIAFGLAIYNKIDKSIDILNTKTSDLLSNSISSIEAEGDDVWIGTIGGSLSLYNHQTRKLNEYQFVSNKIGNTIYSIRLDSSGVIWLGTNNGILAINKNTYKEKHFTINVGLLDKEYNHNALKLDGDFIYFGGPKGITKINTVSLNKPPKNIGEVYISKLEIKSVDRNFKQKLFGPDISDIDLEYGTGIKIFLTTNQLNLPNILNYEYKLSVGNNESYWSEFTESNRELTLDYLQQGKYSLFLRAKNFNNQTLSEKKLSIYVKPPFWLSNIAIFLYLVILFLITYYILHIYIKVKITNEKNLSIKDELDNKKKNIATLSHDLRTPLNSIIMLSDPKLSSSKAKINTIHSAAMLLRSLVSNALDQSLLDIGSGIDIKVTRIDLKKMFLSIVTILESYSVTKEVQIISEINIPDDINFYSDITRLEQMTINILTNAIKHTPANSYVQLLARVNNDTLNINVKDFGKGIPLDEQERIFNPFYKATNNQEEGLGLGLYISKQIISKLGGEISLNSEFKLGAEFVMTIPSSDEQTLEVHDNRINTKRDGLERKGFKILMIDDDIFNRIAFSAMCDQLAIEIKCVGKINELLELEELYDLYILDLNLGDREVDGIVLAEMLSNKGITSPKILLTADIRASEKIEGTSVDDIILKPVTIDELIVTINNNLNLG